MRSCVKLIMLLLGRKVLSTVVIVIGKAGGAVRTTVGAMVRVEEKFEKSVGYLARCEEKFCTTTLQNSKNHAKIDQNAHKMPSKFENRPLKTLFEI